MKFLAKKLTRGHVTFRHSFEQISTTFDIEYLIFFHLFLDRRNCSGATSRAFFIYGLFVKIKPGVEGVSFLIPFVQILVFPIHF